MDEKFPERLFGTKGVATFNNSEEELSTFAIVIHHNGHTYVFQVQHGQWMISKVMRLSTGTPHCHNSRCMIGKVRLAGKASARWPAAPTKSLRKKTSHQGKRQGFRPAFPHNRDKTQNLERALDETTTL